METENLWPPSLRGEGGGTGGEGGGGRRRRGRRRDVLFLQRGIGIVEVGWDIMVSWLIGAVRGRRDCKCWMVATLAYMQALVAFPYITQGTWISGVVASLLSEVLVEGAIRNIPS